MVINALRAADDASYPVLVGAGSMVVVLAGGSWLVGAHLGLGLVGVRIAYGADGWLRALLMWQRWAGPWLGAPRAGRAPPSAQQRGSRTRSEATVSLTKSA